MEYVRDHFEDILKRVHYKDWTFEVHPTVDGATHYYLRVGFKHGDELWHGRKWLLSPHMTDSEIVQTAFLAVKTAEEHETREQFTYLDAAVFGPHLDVDVLFEIAEGGWGNSFRPSMKPGIPVMEQPDSNLETI
jgi:hypothetical protein